MSRWCHFLGGTWRVPIHHSSIRTLGVQHFPGLHPKEPHPSSRLPPYHFGHLFCTPAPLTHFSSSLVFISCSFSFLRSHLSFFFLANLLLSPVPLTHHTKTKTKKIKFIFVALPVCEIYSCSGGLAGRPPLSPPHTTMSPCLSPDRHWMLHNLIKIDSNHVIFYNSSIFHNNISIYKFLLFRKYVPTVKTMNESKKMAVTWVDKNESFFQKNS